MTKTIEEIDALRERLLEAYRMKTTEEHEALKHALWSAEKEYYKPIHIELEAAFLRSAVGADRVDIVDGRLFIWDDPGGGYPPGPMYRWVDFREGQYCRRAMFGYYLKAYKGTLQERVAEYLGGRRGDKT